MESENLLARYFSGQASKDELKLLDNWINASPDNEAEFMRMTKLYEITGLNENEKPHFDYTNAKISFEKHIYTNHKKSNSFRIFNAKRNWIAVAAVLALLIAVGTVMKQANQISEVTIASNSKPTECILPDNTKTALSANSCLKYKTDFAVTNKVLNLTGEAKFSVGKSGKGKLKIAAGETFIEDIGTVFEVTAYEKDNYIQVKVFEGVVKFYTSTDKGLVLHARETGIYNKVSKKFRILAGYKSGRNSNLQLNLDGVTLQQAVRIIENAYQTTIKLAEDNYADKQITVSFSDEQVNTVLSVMSQTLGLRVEKNKDYYLIKK